MKKCVVIINPKSGQNLENDYVFEYQALLQKYDYETIVYFTSYAKHATEIVLNIEDADLVISVGGDGTFNEVVNGNLKRKKRLLLTHIPVGTTNDIGSMFGYGKDPIENLKLALSGVEKGIDICTINNIPFVYVAGFGKFMNVPYETPRDLKSKFGHLAYVVEGAKSFINPTPLYKLKYKVDGKNYEGEYSFVLISNANRIAGFNNFHKDVKLDDKKFEIVFCNLTKKADVVKTIYHIATSNIESAKGFEFFKASELEIKFDNDCPSWCIDGEKLESKNKTFKIKMVNDFRILMPKKNVKKLFLDK